MTLVSRPGTNAADYIMLVKLTADSSIDILVSITILYYRGNLRKSFELKGKSYVIVTSTPTPSHEMVWSGTCNQTGRSCLDFPKAASANLRGMCFDYS